MIKITVDEAYAYDMLSVLHVKCAKQPNDGKAKANWRRLSVEIGGEISDEHGNSLLHSSILGSPEYGRLYDVNLAIFERIDLMKTPRSEQPGDAEFIDTQNHNRYLAKQALQTRFFPSSAVTEQKFGYAK